ncbi:MAG: histidine phosphatase family protein [Pseudomonadota bacterium]
MPRLILMRHAKSDWSDPALEDHARGLNRRGRKSAKALGDWLRAEDFLPDEVLCSSANRTRLTYNGLELAPRRDPNFLSALYLAGADEMMRILRAASGKCVLVIGHNDGIADMARRLITETPSHPRFHAYPTGATLVADLPGGNWREAAWGTAQPISFVVPRELD